MALIYLNLPPEIRNQIYQLVFDGGQEELMFDIKDHPILKYSPASQLSLLLVCKTIYRECKKLAWQNTVFPFTFTAPQGIMRPSKLKPQYRGGTLFARLLALSRETRSNVTTVSVTNSFDIPKYIEQYLKLFSEYPLPNVTRVAMHSHSYAPYFDMPSPVWDVISVFPGMKQLYLAFDEGADDTSRDQISLDLHKQSEAIYYAGCKADGCFKEAIFGFSMSANMTFHHCKTFDSNTKTACLGVRRRIRKAKTWDEDDGFDAPYHLNVYYLLRSEMKEYINQPWESRCIGVEEPDSEYHYYGESLKSRKKRYI